MSFSDLKKNKGNVFNQLQKKLEQGTKTGTVDERFWKPTTDKAGNGFAIIRFLPTCEGEDMPFVKLFSHAFQGPGGWYIENSLTTLGKNDPCGEYNRELWNSGDQTLQEQVRRQARKTYFFSNIYVVKDTGNPDNEGKVFLYRYGKSIHNKIQEAVAGNELEGVQGINPFDFWTGANFKLRTKKKAGYPNYEDSQFDAPGTLGDFSDEELEAIWNKQYKLDPLVAPDLFKTYDQLTERLNQALNLKGKMTVQEQTSDEVRQEKAKRDVTSFNLEPQPTPVRAGVFEGDSKEDNEIGNAPHESEAKDDDVMGYFKSLVADKTPGTSPS
jgi:hypothetical protein